eukprot:2128579-Amphidinium_carterae.1
MGRPQAKARAAQSTPNPSPQRCVMRSSGASLRQHQIPWTLCIRATDTVSCHPAAFRMSRTHT